MKQEDCKNTAASLDEKLLMTFLTNEKRKK